MVKPSAVPSQVAGPTGNSSSSSGIFFQGDGQSQLLQNPEFSSCYGNSAKSIPGAGQIVCGDGNNKIHNGLSSSGPSGGASSSLTDANSGPSGGPHLQRSPSINTESYMRLPASPISYSSNNINISGPSVMDGSLMQQNSNHKQNSQNVSQNQPQHAAFSSMSLLTPRAGKVSFPMDPRDPRSSIQNPNYMAQLYKRPRLDVKDVKQENIMQQQVRQQLLHRPESMQLPTHNSQVQHFAQQQSLTQQYQQYQQYLQSFPPVQRAYILQQQQQQSVLRQQHEQPRTPPMPSIKQPCDNGVCSRRLMQFMYHQRQRPQANAIAYWRRFVAEYYSPRAKERLCLSPYDNVEHHSVGILPQTTLGSWQCDICGSKSGRGFEASFEILPRLKEIKFGSGVVDELLFLDVPRESKFPSGVMMLEYGKAVQESVHEQLRVVREGHLRIVFSPDLKILSWEFCTRRHEEFVPRRLIAPQVNQLVQVAQKCQSTLADGGSDGISHQDLEKNSSLVVTAGRQLARALESQSTNDLGFSKRYVRCLQIAEVVNSMKDLMEFCRENKAGPIDALKNYPKHVTMLKHQMEQVAVVQGLPIEQKKLLALQQPNSYSQMSGGGGLGGSAQAAMSLSNYQNLLMRHNNLVHVSSSSLQQASSCLNQSNKASQTLEGSQASGAMQNSPVSGFANSHHLQQQRPATGNTLLQKTILEPPQGSQVMQEQLDQGKLLQDMSNSSGGSRNNNATLKTKGELAVGSNTSSEAVSGTGPTPNNSLQPAVSDGDSSAAGGNDGLNQNDVHGLSQNLHLSEDNLEDIDLDFIEDVMFSNDLDATGFNWEG